MGQTDWTDLTGLNSAQVVRGPTTGFTRPASGATPNAFVYGFRSLVDDAGVGGKACAVSGFTAVAKGGIIAAAMKKYSSGTGFCPFIALATGTSQSSNAYILGLSNETSYKIVLKKAALNSGILQTDSSVLRSSTQSYTATGDGADAWLHVRLDVIVNPHDEVIINCYQNDLTSNDIYAPSWVAIDGMAAYVDDTIGALTGSLPYTGSFYAVFGHYTNAGNGKVSLFDNIVVGKQTSP